MKVFIHACSHCGALMDEASGEQWINAEGVRVHICNDGFVGPFRKMTMEEAVAAANAPPLTTSQTAPGELIVEPWITPREMGCLIRAHGDPASHGTRNHCTYLFTLFSKAMSERDILREPEDGNDDNARIARFAIRRGLRFVRWLFLSRSVLFGENIYRWEGEILRATGALANPGLPRELSPGSGAVEYWCARCGTPVSTALPWRQRPITKSYTMRDMHRVCLRANKTPYQCDCLDGPIRTHSGYPSIINDREIAPGERGRIYEAYTRYRDAILRMTNTALGLAPGKRDEPRERRADSGIETKMREALIDAGLL